MTQTHQVPRWIVLFIGAMYRFVVGGFGIDLPHPYTAKLCPRLWLVVLPGVTIALPLVLLGWVIRLTLGKGRAERFFIRVGSIEFPKWTKLVLYGLFVVSLFCLLGVLIYLYGWWPVIWRLIVIIGVTIAYLGSIVGFFVLVEQSSEKTKERRRAREDAQEKKPSLFRKILRVALWPLKMLGQVLWFVGFILYSIYKKFCPIVEFP